MYPIPTDIQEESGMRTFRQFESMITELLEELTYAQDASDQIKLTVPSKNYEQMRPAKYSRSFFVIFFVYRSKFKCKVNIKFKPKKF